MTSENIAEIKEKMNVVEVIESFIKLKRQGANSVGLCPFHSEKTGSFTVSPAKGIYKCFGCGRSGDAIQFIVEHEKKTYWAAMEWLAEKYNIKLEEYQRKDYLKPVQRLEKLDAIKLQWFEKERKISNNTLLKLKITEGNEWMPQFPKRTTLPVICFNYYRNGELVNIKFRGPKKSFKLSKDSEMIFYNLDALQGETTAIIVEGEIDTATLVECGIYNVIGVPNGTPPKGNLKLEYLDNCYLDIQKMENVIICVDDDEPGRFLKEELGRRIGKDKCKVVNYPKGCKDPNEVFVTIGKEAVVKMINEATSFPIDGIMQMSDILPTVEDWYENGYPPGSKAGIVGVDHMLRFAPGAVTTITGIPGHGKDEFFNWVQAQLSLNAEWKFGVCGFEETPAETTTKIAEKIIGRAFDYRADENNRITKSQFAMAIEYIKQCFFFYSTDEENTTIDAILETAIRLVKQYGIQGLMINPWNWIEHSKPNGMSETDYVSFVYSKVIRFARRYGVHVFIIAHSTKMKKDANGKYEIPTLYNIAGSANFFNKTHYGICVYRDYSANGLVTVYFQKVKQSWMGQIGWSSFKYDTLTRQYSFVDSSTMGKVSTDDVKELGAGSWKPIKTPIDYSEPTQSTSSEQEELPF